VTRTTGGAGNDEDAGNGDVCVYAYVRVCLRVCVHVHLCVDTRAARLVQKPTTHPLTPDLLCARCIKNTPGSTTKALVLEAKG